jgi:type IV pilus assembly protein PilW
MLIGDLRMTGYVGCSDDFANVTNLVTTDPAVLTTFAARVEGSEDGDDWLPSGASDNKGPAGSDGVTVRYLDPMGFNLTAAMNPSALGDDITFDGVGDLENGDLVGLSDCSTSDVFAATTVDSSTDTITHAAALSKAYDTNAELMRYVARRYFVAAGTNGPALFLAENGGAAEELIEGVESMQVLYGVNTDADAEPDAYVDADGAEAAGWGNVVAVRIGLLMRTIDENVNNEVDSRTYGLLGEPLGPFDDQRRRRVFTATVKVRNNT